MKILITGGAGFIGSHLVDACLQRGDEVAVIDNLSTGLRENIAHHDGNPRFRFLEADIRDRARMQEILADVRPEAVFHLAAQINVRESMKDPQHDVEVNILGSLNLLEAMKAAGCRRLVFSSTGGAMFGGDTPPYSEEDIADPESPYGISKRTVEMLLGFYERQHGIRSTILRYPNVYGPRQNAKGEAGVISIFLEKIKNNETPTIYGDGTQTRDFVHVDDVVSANLHALDRDLVGIYHTGTGRETSVNELWAILARSTGTTLVPQHAPALGEIQRTALDSQKFLGTGWRITHAIEEL